MTDYQGEDLKTETFADQDLYIVTEYCLRCPCGQLTRGQRTCDGFIYIDRCPRTPAHYSVYYNPETGEKYERWCTQPPNKPTTCEIAVAATRENIYIPLKELLIIPKGWTLEVEEDKDSDEYLNLDIKMTLHRIPDQTAYDQWNQDVEQTREAARREEEIARLRERLAQLTDEPLQGEGVQK
jgi:hypothetical protein